MFQGGLGTRPGRDEKKLADASPRGLRRAVLQGSGPGRKGCVHGTSLHEGLGGGAFGMPAH